MSAVRGQVRVGKTFNPAHKDRLFFHQLADRRNHVCSRDCGGRNPVTIPPGWKTGTTREWDSARTTNTAASTSGQAVPRGRAPGILTINPQKPFPVRVLMVTPDRGTKYLPRYLSTPA